MHRSLIILVSLCLAIALARLALLHDYPEWDPATYFLVGDAMIHGKQLYAQVWDMKPPAIFATYAIANLLTGSTFVWTTYLLSVVSATGATIAMYFAGAKLSRNAGLLAATLFAIVSMHPRLGGTWPNTEAFINLFIATGLAIWLHRGDRLNGALLAGACFGIASLYKHVAIAPAGVLAIANVLAPLGSKDVRRAIVRSIALCVPIPLAWAIVFAFFAATGRGWIFYQTNFVYAQYYSGSVMRNLTLAPLTHPVMRDLLPLEVLGGIGIVMVGAIKLRSDRLQIPPGAGAGVLAMFVGHYLAIAMPGQSFEHYQQLWLIPLCLSGAWGVVLLIAQCDLINLRRLIAIATAVIACGLIVLQLQWYLESPRDRAMRHWPRSAYVQSVEVGFEINRMLHADETMYCFCDEAYLYVLANKRPPATAVWKYHTVVGPLKDWLSQRTAEDLARHPPDLAVLWLALPGPEDNPIYRFIAANYDELPGNAGRRPLMLWARRGSDLHARTIEQHDKSAG